MESNDIVDRLRAAAKPLQHMGNEEEELAMAAMEAADEIERLRGYTEAQTQKLRRRVAHWRQAYNDALDGGEKLRGAMAADDERLRAAGQRVGIEWGCDTADAMADEIVTLRALLAQIERESARG